MTKDQAIEVCIAQYVKTGATEARGRFLLRQELRTTSASNLADALVHDGFATSDDAPALAHALFS